MPDKRLSPGYYNKMTFAQSHLRCSRRVLDVGCGEGGYFYMDREMCIKYSGIDPDASVVKKGHPVKVAGAESIPYASGSFDTVVCMDVIEHVENPEKAVSEIARVLESKGKLIMSVPNARFPFTYDPINALLRIFNSHIPIGLWSWGHRRLYHREDVIRLLESQGFEVRLIEERTHGFVSLFVGYIPYFSVYWVSPIMKKLGMKKAKIEVSGRPMGKGIAFKFFNSINKFDGKIFGRTHGVTICLLARKR
jgi:2-polyprenyl-6-hydroxyphenyl methylase / 3-demethylubiquinone-9 3-methyltransferase